mgnify:CR=1 FL=1
MMLKKRICSECGKNTERYNPSKEEITFVDSQVEYEFSELKP